MNTQEQKKLSESLLAACKAAGVEEPKYIAQDLSGAVWHYKDEPDTNNYGAIWATFTAQNKKLDHPPYATDWQDSLLEFRDYALIRKCDKCQAITAIDMIGSDENEKELQCEGETVFRVSKDEARKQVDNLNKCDCKISGESISEWKEGFQFTETEKQQIDSLADEPLANVLDRHPEHIADTSKMIDACDIGYNTYMSKLISPDMPHPRNTYRQAWSDALTWWDGSDQAIGIESLVCADIAKRQQVGLRKYGVTVAENPLSQAEWLQHAYEECLDMAVYLKRAMTEKGETK